MKTNYKTYNDENYNSESKHSTINSSVINEPPENTEENQPESPETTNPYDQSDPQTNIVYTLNSESNLIDPNVNIDEETRKNTYYETNEENNDLKDNLSIDQQTTPEQDEIISRDMTYLQETDSHWFSEIKKFFMFLIAFNVADKNIKYTLDSDEYTKFCNLIMKCYDYSFIKKNLKGIVSFDRLAKYYKMYIPRRYIEIFDYVDKDNNGVWSLKEIDFMFGNRENGLIFVKDVKNYLNKYFPDKFEKYDTSKALFVSKAEYSVYLNRINLKNLESTIYYVKRKIFFTFVLKDKLRSYLDNNDKNNDGFYNSEEIYDLLTKIGYNGLRAENIIDLLDRNQYGKIPINSFTKKMFGFTY